jgi:hypothetical protein
MIAGTITIDTGAGYDSATIRGSYPNVILGVDLGAGNDTFELTGDVGAISALDGDGGNDDLDIPAAQYALYSSVITGFETIQLT